MRGRTRRSSAVDYATRYAHSVVNGNVVAGPHVRASCRRHLRDLKRRDGVWFDVEAGDRVIKYFETRLQLRGGLFDGKPFMLEPWQKFLLASMFGWKMKSADQARNARREHWPRRFKRVYVEIAKGAGKTHLAAGLGLYMLCEDGEEKSEVYAVASTKDQARLVFAAAVDLTLMDPQRNALLNVRGGTVQPNMIFDYGTRSKFEPLSQETARQSGASPHCALVDELHDHRNHVMVETVWRGMSKWRRQPIMLEITNSGYDKSTICWEEREHAVAVAAGEVDDDTTLSYVCALDDSDDPFTDPTCWRKANPMIGVTVSEDAYQKLVKEARQIPGKRNRILNLHFCQWTGSAQAWIAAEDWEKCERSTIRIDDFRGKRCVAGLDLSSTKDLTALTLAFDDGMTEPKSDLPDDVPRPRLVLFTFAWKPAATLVEAERTDRQPYALWAEQGYLELTPGSKIDHNFVVRKLAELHERFGITLLAYDKYHYPVFADAMRRAGLAIEDIRHPQGTEHSRDSKLWMPQSIGELESGIIDQRIIIEQSPLLRAAVAGATLYEDSSGNRRWRKGKDVARIDPLVSMSMAVGAMVTPEPEVVKLSDVEKYYQQGGAFEPYVIKP